MLSSAIIDLAIGLVFVFAVTAAMSSALTELIARLFGLRGAYLLSGLRELVDCPQTEVNLSNAVDACKRAQNIILTGAAATEQPAAEQPAAGEPAAGEPAEQRWSMTSALLGSPILRSQGMVGDISSRKLTMAPSGTTGSLPKMQPPGRPGSSWRVRRSLPSYIPSRSFAEAVIDLVVPDGTGATTLATIERNIGYLPDSPLTTSLQALATDADGDLSRFRTAVEHWYDDHMDRVSGWYKRYTAKITLVIGAVLVVLFNINTLTIARTLYTQSVVSQAVSVVAAKTASCPSGQSGQNCLITLEEQISSAATAGLPIGWGTVRDCRVPKVTCNWWDRRGITSPHGNSAAQVLLVLAGFLITIIALVPGARFWFGLLSKLSALRTSGPKPSPASS